MAVAGFFFASLFYDKPSTATLGYDIHFDTPVEGLEKGSEVRYMGIKMGEVTKVFLLPADPARVVVRVMVDVGTPVNTATVATLRQQGLTGVPFVNLAQDDTLKPAPLLAVAGQAYPVILTKPTELDALVQKLPDLEKNLSVLLSAANDVLSSENRQHFAELLANLDVATTQLPALMTSLNQSSRELSALVVHIKQTSQRVDTLAQDIDRVVVNNEGRVNELLGEGGENLKQLLAESRKTAVAVRQLSNTLEQNPSQLIYQPVPQGTELPR